MLHLTKISVLDKKNWTENQSLSYIKTANFPKEVRRFYQEIN